MTICQRPTTLDDEPFIRRLIAAAVATELQVWSWPDPLREQVIQVQYAARRQSIRAAFPEAKDRIILLNGNDIGWIVISESPFEIRLVEIIIYQDERGKGIGSEMIRRLLAEAKIFGKPVRLSVHTDNVGAIRFYERFGFCRADGGDEVRHQMQWKPL